MNFLFYCQLRNSASLMLVLEFQLIAPLTFKTTCDCHCMVQRAMWWHSSGELEPANSSLSYIVWHIYRLLDDLWSSLLQFGGLCNDPSFGELTSADSSWWRWSHVSLDLPPLAISGTIIRTFTAVRVGIAAAIRLSLILSQNHLWFGSWSRVACSETLVSFRFRI